MNATLNIDEQFIKASLKQALLELLREKPSLILDAIQALNQEVVSEKTITKKRPLPVGAGQYNSGRGDVSINAERLLFSEQMQNIQQRKNA